ncbi:M15 family metallopeptidase [Anaerobacillus sp. 1_MG-2023]|uniref:M15 family metallopeptidase n=1 Tax=Anaerobacillus sp. 1_MG-2023 TaxID=3062655 RepID=UPI0026E22D19|nr:M15 family metallopeptidase [Anaerobacillus sp. 1_MG-2023]MDO6655250.1 M15 family metallopeptidase [Anaerobacillus sp. 1_MG-2023]
MKRRSKNLITFLFIIGVGIFCIYISDDLEKQFIKKDVPLPTDLHPKVNEARKALMNRAAEAGIEIVITAGHRTKEEQDALYEKGRSTGGQVVTNVAGGGSYHNYGLAIDFALKLDDGDVVWDMKRDDNGNGKSDWMEVVDMAKDLGFEWGGDWSSFKDYPHLQMDFGFTMRELKNGHRPDESEYATN